MSKALLKAGGKGTLLEAIFLRTGRTPDEILDKPAWVVTFCLESMRDQLEQEYRQYLKNLRR